MVRSSVFNSECNSKYDFTFSERLMKETYEEIHKALMLKEHKPAYKGGNFYFYSQVGPLS